MYTKPLTNSQINDLLCNIESIISNIDNIKESVKQQNIDVNQYMLTIFIPSILRDISNVYDEKQLKKNQITKINHLEDTINKLQKDILDKNKKNTMFKQISEHNIKIYDSLCYVSKHKIDEERNAFKDQNDSKYTEIDCKIEAEKHLLEKISNLSKTVNDTNTDLHVATEQVRIFKILKDKISNVITKLKTSINQLEKQKEEQDKVGASRAFMDGAVVSSDGPDIKDVNAIFVSLNKLKASKKQSRKRFI